MYDEWIHPQTLADALDKAAEHISRSQGNHWAAVRGPCSAALATAWRIGWRFASSTLIVTDTGEELDLTADSPATIDGRVQEAVRRWRNANIAEFHPATKNLATIDGDGVYADSLSTSPLPPQAAKQIARATKAQGLEGFCADFGNLSKSTSTPKTAPFWERRCGPYLASATAGRQWPQARVAATRHEAWGTDNRCTLCKTAVGNLLHRLCCPITTPAGGWPGPPDAIEKTWKGLGTGTRDLLLTRGIYFEHLPCTPDNADGIVHWITEITPAVPQNELVWYIDGSLINPEHRSTARLGVGLAAVDANGSLCAAAFARPPPWVRTIPAAEAWALWVVLDNTNDRRAVITDCQGNVSTLRNGRTWATAAARKAARVWADIFYKIGQPGNTDWLIWMPAHRTRKDVGVRRKSHGTDMAITDLRANALVDELAKHAAVPPGPLPCVEGRRATPRRRYLRARPPRNGHLRFAERQHYHHERRRDHLPADMP